MFLFLTEEAYIHGGLQTGKLGQTPLEFQVIQLEIEVWILSNTVKMTKEEIEMEEKGKKVIKLWYI